MNRSIKVGAKWKQHTMKRVWIYVSDIRRRRIRGLKNTWSEKKIHLPKAIHFLIVFLLKFAEGNLYFKFFFICAEGILLYFLIFFKYLPKAIHFINFLSFFIYWHQYIHIPYIYTYYHQNTRIFFLSRFGIDVDCSVKTVCNKKNIFL